MAKKNLQRLTEHHIIPKSRGGKSGENICYVKCNLHQKYHYLFENKTPDEIVDYLNHTFWANKYIVHIYEK